jgi:Flp pilus assembly pilin Flp
MKKHLKSKGLEISFEKSLRSQSTLEYFILFTIIALFTVIGMSTFFPKIQQSFSAMQSSAVARIVNSGN